MSPEEIQFLVGLLPGFSVGVLVAAGVGYLLVKHFASGYLGQKGKNLADKEDIARLTHEVEQVKRQHAEVLEAVRFRNQLRLAGVDRRLQAHQEAFALLWALVDQMHAPDVREQVQACVKWWQQNCLYLEPSAREAFVDTYSMVSAHDSLMRASLSKTEAEVEQLGETMAAIHRNWERIMDSINVVLEAVALPPLSANEEAALRPPERASSLLREEIVDLRLRNERGEHTNG